MFMGKNGALDGLGHIQLAGAQLVPIQMLRQVTAATKKGDHVVGGQVVQGIVRIGFRWQGTTGTRCRDRRLIVERCVDEAIVRTVRSGERSFLSHAAIIAHLCGNSQVAYSEHCSAHQ